MFWTHLSAHIFIMKWKWTRLRNRDCTFSVQVAFLCLQGVMLHDSFIVDDEFHKILEQTCQGAYEDVLQSSLAHRLLGTEEDVAEAADLLSLLSSNVEQYFKSRDSGTELQEWVDPLTCWRLGCNRKLEIFKLISRTGVFPVKLALSCPLANARGVRPHWWLVNIDSGDGLVQSGNKPLL